MEDAMKLLLLPLPLQGHLNPMLQLGELLHSQGSFSSITIILLQYPHSSSSANTMAKQYPHLSFLPLPKPSSSSSSTTAATLSTESSQPPLPNDLVPFILNLNENLTIPLKDVLMEELKRDTPKSSKITCCLISDVLMFGSRVAAEEVGIQRVALRTGNAASFHVFNSFPMLWEKGYLPLPPLIPFHDEKLDVAVPELPPFRLKDLPNFQVCDQHKLYQLITQMLEDAKSARALILNTLEALEGGCIAKIREDQQIPLLFNVGPLHKHISSKNIDSYGPPATQIDGGTCLEWLDSMAAESVLYVSFGSLAYLEEEEVLETAWGLANSSQPFLWVLRKGEGSATVGLPEAFLEEVRGRGRVVEWAPQKEVLKHPSVGGFWTHCGWNSTLESVCEGVPMLCWPCFGDQMVNARVIEQVWKVGLYLGKVLRREEIKRAVRDLMVGEAGKDMRKRARVLKEEVEPVYNKQHQGKPHYACVDKLVQFILSLHT